jgi:hypothetical protein
MSLRPNSDITEISWYRNRSGFQVIFKSAPLDNMPGERPQAQELAEHVGLTLVEDEDHVARWVRDSEGWPLSPPNRE